MHSPGQHGVVKAAHRPPPEHARSPPRTPSYRGHTPPGTKVVQPKVKRGPESGRRRFFCAGFPEPPPGEWPVRWRLSRQDIVAEIEHLLETDEGDDTELTLSSPQRRWLDAYAAALSLVRAKRMWRRYRRAEKRKVLFEWAAARSEQVEAEIKRQSAKAANDKGLELPGLKLREVPHELMRLPAKVAGHVKRLALHDNRIECLPPELFDRYTEVTTLRLSDNRIPIIPPTIQNLTSLQMLLIGDNDLCILPAELGNLVSLHTLHVQGNKRLRRLPREMGKLHHTLYGGNLKDLQYDVERVTFPPPETVEQGLNVACDLMRRVWDAADSGRLILSGMMLTSVPPYICDMPLVTALTELNIFQNKISRLPPAMGLLTRLDILRLDESSIVFPNQHLMKQSEAMRNPETRMLENAACAPFMGFLRRIADCRLHRSMVLQGGSWRCGGSSLTLKLSVISSEILSQGNCKLLDVRHNDLKDIPQGIAHLELLTALHVDHNRIRHIPESLGALVRLRAFTAHDNDLFEVPEVFAGMTSLVSLDLGKNGISKMPVTVTGCTSLTRLNLSHNKIQELPDTLSRLTSLRYLYVGHNPLSQLPAALGASHWLQEVTADCCFELGDLSPQEVLNGTVPPRCPLADPQMGKSHLLSNVHRLVGMLAQPKVIETFRHVIQLKTLVADIQTEGCIADAELPEPVLDIVRMATKPHVNLTDLAPLEKSALEGWKHIEYEPADTVYSRRFRLTKEATIRSVDAVIVNQVVAAGLPQMGRSPPLVRYLWGLWTAQEVGIADLSGTGIINLKQDVLRLSWITKLMLSYNRLVLLPQQITTLTQLVTIDLGHNQLTTLPGYFGQLTTLVEINLCYNMLDSLPKEMASLSNWTYPRNPKAMHLFTIAWAEGNPLTFPHHQILQLGPGQTRGFLRQVTAAVQTGFLDFQHRELPLFPDQLTDFDFLVNIDLSYNKIDRIPPAITNMVQLRSCVLSGNTVDRLPPRLSTLTSLELLDIRDNQLVGLPDSIGLLHAELKKLLLGRNRISSLPNTLGLLSNLVHLHLNWNQLKSLPEEIGRCTSLEELQLSYNQLRLIPQTFSNLTNLKFAALQNNLLELLPTCLGNMQNLHKLAFDNNMWLMPQQEVLQWSDEHNRDPKLKLSTGMRVWARFQSLNQWRPARVDIIHEDGTFDLSYKFDRDPHAGLDREVNVPRVQVLEREESGQKVQVESEIVKPLSDHDRLVDFLTRLHSCGKSKDLDFSGFHMTEFLDYEAGSGFRQINEAGWYTRGLRKLNLSYNWLSTLPLSVSRLSTLTCLDLKHNCIIGLPETLSVLVCLKEVDLSYNRLTVLPCGLGLAAELETIATHHNPLMAPPVEIIRQGAAKIVRYLRGIHMARKNGKLDWNKLNLCTIDTLIVMLPEGDAALIQELYLDDNMIVVLNPGVLCELQNLEVFRCCRNYLTVLHPNLASFCPKLEQVTVDGNRLTHLPATLGTLTALLSLSCDDNPHLMSPPSEIAMMPSSSKIRYCQELHKSQSEAHDCSGDFSDFGLRDFPEAMMDLWRASKLNFSNNNLIKLHPGICRWEAITVLNLEHNKLVILEATLGLCYTLTELNVSNNCLRRIPPEYGNFSNLKRLTILPQRCAPAKDINGRTQGFSWCTAEKLTLRHVHNVEDCKIYSPRPVEESLVCPVCLKSGDLGVTLFPAEKCHELLDQYLEIESARKQQGKPSKPQPTRTCPTCGTNPEIRHLMQPPELQTNNVRVWLPSILIHMNTWCPPLPASTFRASYTREIPGREPADSRPQPDSIDSPPPILLEGEDGVQVTVAYLKQCLQGRQRGCIDVCGFGIPQFPLDALDTACLKELKASNNRIKDVPDDLDRLTNLQVLHLDHNLLETLPPGVRFLTALQDLQLNDNLLHEICPELGACVNLQKLNLHQNRLVTLPHTMGNCNLLTQLTIQKNDMIVLPPALSECQKSMQHLDLDRDAETNCYRSPPNPIPQQSSFQFLRYLNELYTYSKECRLLTPGYHLDYIPDLMLEAATSVTALSLDENNITELPEAIGTFTLLTELFSVSDNAISIIPACVGNMTKLTCLRLSGNSLVDLPDELSSMQMLKTFLVDHNSLSDFNRCFSTMTCLELLSFADNKIREVHPEFGLISSIHTLRMHENPIVLPGPEIFERSTPQIIDYLGRIKVSQFTGYLDLGTMDLQSLLHQLHDAYEARVINLAGNRLTSLPQDFHKFQNCEELILDGNPMPYLEDSVGKLKRLQLLSLEKMKEPLKALPDNTFGGLRALVVLRMADNVISSLPDVFKFLTHMEFIDMTRNQLTRLPPSLMNCKKLKVLLLSENRLSELVKGFSNFHELHTLDVSKNCLTVLSRGMGSLSQYHKLKNHDLSDNAWIMPPVEIQKQGERKMLKYVGDLWRAKLANGIKMVEYQLTQIYPEILQENLVELNLDMNLITEIAPQIGKLKKLEELSVIKNRITALPEEIFDLKLLSVLKVDDNKISEIPKSIRKLSRCLTWFSIERNPIRFFPGELANMEVLEIINASPLGLDADVKHAFNAGFETFVAYMKAWSTVNSTGRLQLNWNANSAWDPMLQMPVQCWRFADTLTIIYLNDNNISMLPQNIAIMQALKELHLERNGLCCLPYVMCQMTNLKVLNLTDNNELHDPPYEIFTEMKLTGIMSYLRAMHMAPLLKSLILNNFDLYYLKPNDLIQTTVEDLTILRKKAEFARSDGKARNPGEVARINRRLALFDIQALSLDHNSLVQLPDLVLLFTRLAMLTVSHNQLEALSVPPSNLKKWSSLTVLHLDNNRLADGSIPPELASNVHLKKLMLNHNELSVFPEVILQLTALEVLNLASNKIQELPPELPSCNSNLKMLALQRNEIPHLPADWGLMQKLVKLDMTNNNLIHLPPSIANCRRLKALYLSENPLPAFPKDILQIRGLQQLRCAKTLMKGLPPELALLTNLKELALEDTALAWPPAGITWAALASARALLASACGALLARVCPC